MNEEGYEEGARWLLSDGIIIGKTIKHHRKDGTILLTLPMPWGEDYSVAVEKLNANSMSQFCAMARGEYDEWKASKASAQARKADGGGNREPQLEAAVPALETTVAVDFMDPASVSARCVELHAEERGLLKRIGECAKERSTLERILEVLTDAQEDDVSEPSGIPRAESGGVSQGVDRTPRPVELQLTREEDTNEVDKVRPKLELTSTDAEEV